MQTHLLRQMRYVFILHLALLYSFSSFAQTTISGKVSDEGGGTLPGVNVLVKGTNAGTITDTEGNYSLSVPSGDATLVFSFIGYNTHEEPVNGRSTIDVILLEDVQSLSEVVVVGYGTQKKETVTGSVVTVKGKDLVKSPAVNLSNSLAGRMPGVVAVNRSGEPGYDGSGIRIRGSNTLGNNDALIVIDGIPARQGGIERINPADIENISVLKDASAAIYGARAANGVILITTKRGQSGKPELSYSYNQGWAQPTVIPQLADATQFAEMRNELEIYNLPADEWSAAQNAFRQTGTYVRPNGSEIKAPYSPDDFQKFADGSDPWGHPNTDWYDATLKPWSPQSRHNLQLTGGTEAFKYLASLSYQNQDAFYRDAATGYKQYDFRVNLDANVNKYIKTTIGVLGRQENRFFPTVGAGAIFRMQMRGIPTQPAYWPNGLPGPDIENGQNPVVITTNQTGYDRDTRYYVQTNGSVDVTIPWVKGLKFTGTAAVDKYIRRTKRWEIPWYLYTWDKVSYEDDGVTPKLVPGKRGPAEPRLNQSDEDQLNILLGGIFTYERTFGGHALTVLAGTNRETIQNDGFSAYRRYFISPVVDQMAAGGNAERNNGGGAWERARLNYFGRVAYNYKEKYLAEFLWRYDGSYMFPEATRYGFFPGFLAGWQISEESFWKESVPWVNYLKLRGSWGQMGNDQVYYDANRNGVIDSDEPLQEYQYLSTNAFRSYIIGGQEVLTLYETRVPNPSITWEIANNADIGLEGQLMQGRFFFELDVFYNKRTNILWPKFGSIPQSTGMSLPPQNIGKVANRGFEFLLGHNGQVGELSYNVSVNGGYSKNKVLFWDEAPGAPAWQRTTGKPMYTYQAYIYDGVFKDQSAIDANTIDYSAITQTLRPGDMKYVDYNNDGKITPDDQVRNDKTNIPTFQGGVNIGAQFKNFDLSILFQGAAGAQVYISPAEMGSIGNYLLDMYENRWTVDNPSDEHPRIADRGNQYFSFNNTYWLRSTDYIRLKNLELGYTLPSPIVDKIGIGNLRVYVNGLNLATVSKLKVYDPENANPTGQYYPQSRIINTGLTVTF
ncbi:TonB-linked outer membrane protein, SusC/RagA family [Catalinimonas alkaloidigena]|uniref:TonB-linked outer membrane protein, SusC/RagA family n=1 Tax=Catalinimonas alkaloidigena TaxID=1075417 RepID=A0A1G9F8A3_9BACT|nr:TonB-dependent receptor [Catalinimonas alkaloidigena]SDK84590.1 TonB-linked outer membrane protein, SusC/RagA family [Catalinimonas alkaloidigena]